MSPLDRAIMRATWSWPSITLLLIVALFPFYGSQFPRFDGWLFPVTGKMTFSDVRPADGGVTVRLSYTKLRDCEYLGASMDHEGVSVDFYPVDGGVPTTLATGQHVSRPWFIGSPTVDGLHLRFVHRCNPLYTTVSDVYP